MKIAWFTPLSIGSAIGKYSRSVTGELAKHCDVHIWTADRKDLLPTNVKIIHFDPRDDLAGSLKYYDFVVYNMGDSIEFHKEIYEASKKFKGIVILHDYILHHFFLGYYSSAGHNLEEYVRDMGTYYGAAAANTARDSVQGRCVPVFETDAVMMYPLYEKAIQNAIAVIVHSKYHADGVDKKFLGPIKIIGHPYRQKYAANDRPDWTSSDLADERIVIVTIGYVNANKRSDKVIQVLGNDPGLAKKVQYLIIGPYDPRSSYFQQLNSSIGQYGLDKTVRTLGYVSDGILETYLRRADIFINLRYPVMEGASWSVIEELGHGKPVIVTDAGPNGELPEDCVIKVGLDHEIDDLHSALNRLVDDKTLREEVGSKGRKFVKNNFSPEKYCMEFLELLDEVRSQSPMIDLIDKTGDILGEMGVLEDMDVVDVISREINVMFGKGSYGKE